MSGGEQEVLADLVARVEQLLTSADEALELAAPMPNDLAAFESMSMTQRVATKAVIKSVEELEEQVMRLFRTILHLLAVDTADLYARDIADHMEQLGIVADAAGWMEVVKLRNRLVHDYPLTPEARFDKLVESEAAIALMRDTAKGAFAFVRAKNWRTG